MVSRDYFSKRLILKTCQSNGLGFRRTKTSFFCARFISLCSMELNFIITVTNTTDINRLGSKHNCLLGTQFSWWQKQHVDVLQNSLEAKCCGRWSVWFTRGGDNNGVIWWVFGISFVKVCLRYKCTDYKVCKIIFVYYKAVINHTKWNRANDIKYCSSITWILFSTDFHRITEFRAWRHFRSNLKADTETQFTERFECCVITFFAFSCFFLLMS